MIKKFEETESLIIRPDRGRKPASEKVIKDVATVIVNGFQGTIVGTYISQALWNISCDMLRTVPVRRMHGVVSENSTYNACDRIPRQLSECS
ncbi:hypothetical protein TNCV_363141 [Trichonephila clavipes]|nr:hypothetical protein TNCV_363141 [Trichonephila clavipes]